MTSQPTPTKAASGPGGPGEPGSGLQAAQEPSSDHDRHWWRHRDRLLQVGSSSGIAAAGPGILLSYALVGTLVVLVMRMLGEMSAANPTSGSFSARADRALGRWAGFSIGWLWFFWVVVLAVEATAEPARSSKGGCPEYRSGAGRS